MSHGYATIASAISCPIELKVPNFCHFDMEMPANHVSILMWCKTENALSKVLTINHLSLNTLCKVVYVKLLRSKDNKPEYLTSVIFVTRTRTKTKINTFSFTWTKTKINGKLWTKIELKRKIIVKRTNEN